MQIYEISILVPAELSQKEVQDMALAIENIVQDKGGILIEERKKKNIELGYAIEHKTRAVLVTCKFQISADKLKDIEQNIKEKDNILRFLLEKQKKSRKISEKKRGLKAPVEQTIAKKREIKVGLKEIEEKLEEILDES